MCSTPAGINVQGFPCGIVAIWDLTSQGRSLMVLVCWLVCHHVLTCAPAGSVPEVGR